MTAQGDCHAFYTDCGASCWHRWYCCGVERLRLLCRGLRNCSARRTLFCADADAGVRPIRRDCVRGSVAKATQRKISGYSAQMLGHRHATPAAVVVNSSTDSTTGGHVAHLSVVPVQGLGGRLFELGRGGSDQRRSRQPKVTNVDP